MKIKRVLITAAVILVGYLLQAGVFAQYNLFNVTPNILLMITCIYSFMRGRKEGIFIGVVCGVLTDIFIGGTIGVYTLFFAYLGWFNGLFYKLFFMDYIVFPLAMIIISDFFFGIYVYIVNFLINGRMNFMFYLSDVIIPEMIYTFAVSILLCHIIIIINLKLDEAEKRSAAKFVQ